MTLCYEYEGRCGNCHGLLQDGDDYCRVCGTKRGEGSFEPYRNLMQAVYGPPPIKRVHKCKECGYQWVATLMVDKQDFCPKCGSKVMKYETGFMDESEFGRLGLNEAEASEEIGSPAGERVAFCSNCGNRFGSENRYCDVCGAERNEGPFKPQDNIAMVLYGPMPMGKLDRIKRFFKRA